MPDAWGRECKLGWGYNKSLYLVVPVEGEPPNVTSEIRDHWEHWIYNLSSTDVYHWDDINISLLLEPTFRKFLDFQIVFHDSEYWLVCCQFTRRKEESQKLPNYPSNCGHFIREVKHGVDLWVLFPKAGFPEDIYDVWNLFGDRNFNETQGKVRCKILINYHEVRETTLEELSDFMEEIKEGKHTQYNIPTDFYCKQFSQKVKKNAITKEDEFTDFLIYLYCVYRKVEIQMEKYGYPGIIPDLDTGEKSFMSICLNLDKAKEDYKLMNKKDFLAIYQVLKRLFFSYTDYIRYSLEHSTDMDDGGYLPGAIDEIESWLCQLNSWSPINVNETWINTMNSLVFPPGYKQITDQLHMTNKFRDLQVVYEKTEPYITKENNQQTLFGFVDMKGTKKVDIPQDATVFKSICPAKCTPDLRRWICSTCGHFILRTYYILFCHCGSKNYEGKLLTCSHPRHWTRCKVWINYDNVKEMNLKELLQFEEDIEWGKCPNVDIPTSFYYQKLNGQIQGIKISNDDELTDFISHLYFAYRKIEKKMKDNGYPDIPPDFNSEEKSLVNVCVELKEAKNAFKSVNKNDFLKMYPILKRLFFAYTDYVKYSVELENNMDEGNYLPGTISELKSYLVKLKAWFPVKINGEWSNSVDRFIGTPKGFEEVIRQLQETIVFAELPVFSNDKATEPYIGEERNKRTIFGFINMEGATRSDIPSDVKVCKVRCPKKCRKKWRKWVCISCGEFVFRKHSLLFCSCGSKAYAYDLFICHHPSHRSQDSIKEESDDEIPPPPGANMGEIQDPIVNYDSLLPSICQELQKIQIRDGEATDPKIFIAIIKLLSNRNEEETKNALKELRGIYLDGDTHHMINMYLNKSN